MASSNANRTTSRVLRFLGVAAAFGGLLTFSGTAPAASGDYLSDPLYGGLDRGQIAAAAISVQDALETKVSGQAFNWRNEDKMLAGSVTPLRTFKTRSGYFCREYLEVLVIAEDHRRERKRTASRDNPGRWVPLEI